MNIVALVGNVVADPELRYTQAGKAITNFRIAISRPNGETADFINIVCFERQAEIAEEYLSKGRRVGIEGRLSHSTWETDAGDKRSKVEVLAHRVHLLGTRQDQAASVAVPAGVAADEGNPF